MIEKTVNMVDLFPEGNIDVLTTMMDESDAHKIDWKLISKGPIGEKDVFDAEWKQIATYYFGNATQKSIEAGAAILSLFNRYKPVADLFTRFVLKSDQTTGRNLHATLIGNKARGESQAFIRPLVLRSFVNASYMHTPPATGPYNYLPTVAGAETATDGEQAWIIIGFIEPVSGRIIPYDEIQMTINDAIKTRRPLYPQMNMEAQGENLKIVDNTTPAMIQPTQTLDIDLTIRTANVQFGLWPLGAEVITANAAQAAGPIN